MVARDGIEPLPAFSGLAHIGRIHIVGLARMGIGYITIP
jgi:hypothetical protein